MALETGTLVLTDYTAKIKDTGQIFETTRREDAEKAGIADPTKNYEPKLIAVGDPTWSLVLKGFDEAIQKAEPGQTLDIELPPDKAFGPRDPNKLSRMPLRRFGEKASDLSVGAEVEVDNRVGIVRQIESGRALVDFNHRYAGKTLEYQVSIREKLEDKRAKIEALIRRRLPVEKEKLKFESENDSSIRIYVPNDLLLWEGLQITKRGISSDLFKFLKSLDKVSFEEDYENPAKKTPEQKQGKEKTEVGPAARGISETVPREAETGPAVGAEEATSESDAEEEEEAKSEAEPHKPKRRAAASSKAKSRK